MHQILNSMVKLNCKCGKVGCFKMTINAKLGYYCSDCVPRHIPITTSYSIKYICKTR